MFKSLFNKVVDLQAGNFIEKRLQHRCFPVNVVKIFKTAFFKEYFGWLLLKLMFYKRWADETLRVNRASLQYTFSKYTFLISNYMVWPESSNLIIFFELKVFGA